MVGDVAVRLLGDRWEGSHRLTQTHSHDVRTGPYYVGTDSSPHPTPLPTRGRGGVLRLLLLADHRISGQLVFVAVREQVADLGPTRLEVPDPLRRVVLDELPRLA